MTAFYPELELGSFYPPQKNANTPPPVPPEEAGPGACVESRGVRWGWLRVCGTCGPLSLRWGRLAGERRVPGAGSPPEWFKVSSPCAINTDLWQEQGAGDL